MTESQLEAWLAPRLAPWETRAIALVERRITDARSHAEGAVSQAILDAPDGRSTWQIATRSRFVVAAETRLRELLDQLVGPTPQSLSGLLRKANATFYREAVLDVDWPIPEEWRSKSYGRVLKRRRRDASGLVVFDRDLRTEIGLPIDRAISDLKSTVVRASQQGTSRSSRKHTFDLWEAGAKASIGTVVRNALSNNQFALFQLAGRDQVDARYQLKTRSVTK